MRLCLACALAVTAPAALACPTGLGAGLVYVDAEGTTTTVTPTDRPDVLREDVRFEGGEGYVIEALFGLFELSITDLDAGFEPIPETRMTTVFAQAPAFPGPVSAASGIAAQVSEPGGGFRREISVSAGAMGPVEIGGCTYEGYRIDQRVDDEGHVAIHTYLHVPALGVSVYVGYADGSESETYRIVRIEALGAAPAASAPASK